MCSKKSAGECAGDKVGMSTCRGEAKSGGRAREGSTDELELPLEELRAKRRRGRGGAIRKEVGITKRMRPR